MSQTYQGAVLRFSPDETALACLDAEDDADKWCALESGTVDYLKITPSSDGSSTGTFEWVSDKSEANPELYAGTEGAHVEDGIFTFSTILDKYLFQLDLAAGTYTKSAVPFASEPDNLRLLGGVVYLCTGKSNACLLRLVYFTHLLSSFLILPPYCHLSWHIVDNDDNPGDAVWRWDDKGASRMFYEVRT